MTPTRFCFAFLIAGLAIAAGIAAFNAVADPYLLFDFPRYTGFNAIKPAVATRERLIKTYEAPRRSVRTVILGSSRTDIGFDPSRQIWPPESRPIYNFSLAGEGLSRLTRLLQHLVASHPPADGPRTVIVGLDFEYFLFRPKALPARAAAAESRVEIDNSGEERLLVLEDGRPNPARRLRVVKDLAAAVLSLDAFADSIATIAANRTSGSANMETGGNLSEAVFRHFVAADGVAALFRQKNIETIRQYSAPHQILSETPGGPIRELSALRRLIALCKTHGISATLFVQPSHADRLVLFDWMGYAEDFERWKRALTELVAAERDKGADVTLWDFGGFDAVAQEPVPAVNDRTSRLRWFWEPAHYTTALGDLLVRRMLRQQNSENIGVELTPQTVDSRIADVRREREDYRAKAQTEIQRLAALYCGVVQCGQAIASQRDPK